MSRKFADDHPHIILVEPGLDSPDGHMRGELEAIARGLHLLNVDCSIVGWSPPAQPLNTTLKTHFASHRFESLLRFLPPRIGVRMLEFQVYRKAFAVAQKARNPVVIGLTASGPFGPALASLSSRNVSPTILITRHTGGAFQSMHSPWRLAFEALAKRKVAFGAYSTLVERKLRNLLPNPTTLIRHLPEVIAATPTVASNRQARPVGVLMVSGLDSPGRRAPIHHLIAAQSIPFKKVILHDPSGRFAGCDDLQRKHGRDVVFDRIASYFTDDFLDFLQTASAVLVAYNPTFINPSSVLRHALSAGVPTVTTRFPDSDFLVGKFGYIGELWDFGDVVSMNLAMSRLVAWQKKDFEMLESASQGLQAWAGPVASASSHLDFAMDVFLATGRIDQASPQDLSNL